MDILLRLLTFFLVAAIPCIAVLWRSDDAERRAAFMLGVVVVIITFFYNTYYLYPPTFDPSIGLPLQVCDLLGFASVLALIVDWRLAKAIVVLCAIPFVSQAVLTPVGEQHLTSLHSFLYWSFHVCIFSTFLFEVLVRRFRLHIEDFLRICLLDFAYVCLVTTIDVHYGWNYGYIGNSTPGVATLVDILGPWPFRILNMSVLAVALQFGCYLMFKDRSLSNVVR